VAVIPKPLSTAAAVEV